MAHNQVILSDSNPPGTHITKTLHDEVDMLTPSSSVNNCDMCCSKVPSATTSITTTTEALINPTLNQNHYHQHHSNHQSIANTHDDADLDIPRGSEPQTLQQAVVELVELEEKKVFANEIFNFTNTTEPIQTSNQFKHGHHHHHHHHYNHNNNNNITANSMTNKNNNMKRAPAKFNQLGHVAERPFGCHICGFTFSRNDHLVRHVNSHHKAKNFKCEVCGKALSRRDHLKVHLRIHSGERPYKCMICGFAFSRHDHLVKHNQPNKGRRKLSCVPQPGLKIEPDADLPIVTTTPIAMTAESGEIVFTQAQVQTEPQSIPLQQQQLQQQQQPQQQQPQQQQPQQQQQQQQQPQTQVISHIDVLNQQQQQQQQLVTTTAAATVVPTTTADAVENVATQSALSLQTANGNGQIEIIAQPQQQQQQIYQAISAAGGGNTLQVYPVTQLFPTTFQVSPTTAQIFPTTIQMNAATAQIIPLQMYTTQLAAPMYPKQ